MTKPLGLAVPERCPVEKGAFSIRPKQVEQWTESLPKAHLGETGRLIYNALVETNQQQLDVQDRARFLESLREQVHYVTDSMRKHFVGITYPLPEKSQKVAIASREILSAMATGYKIAVEDMAATNILFQDSKLLTTVLQRAIYYTGRVLLNAYQVYSPCPEHTWSELHKLFVYAEAHNYHKTTVADDQYHLLGKTTIMAEYCRISLTALASPYHLRQGEITKVYETLESWSQHCELTTVDKKISEQTNNLFVIRTNQDKPPRPLTHVPLQEEHLAIYRLINTAPLAKIITNELQNSEDLVATTLTSIDLSRPMLSYDLMHKLLIAWGVETKRSFPRSPRSERVHITIGLNATHKLISTRGEPQGELQELNDQYDHVAHYDSSEVKSLNDTAEDIWNTVYPSDISGIDRSSFTTLLAEEVKYLQQFHTTESSDPVNEEQSNWAILNESASGYCLEYEDMQTTRAQVGELIGIRRNGDRDVWKWGIGVIRWIKSTAEHHLQLGIEMLNPNAAAIGIRPVAGYEQENNFQRTLLLPEIKAINQPATLITSPVQWRSGHQATLNVLGKEMHVALTQVVQITGLFSQYQFEIQEKKKEPVLQQTSHAGEIDFGQIWSTI